MNNNNIYLGGNDPLLNSYLNERNPAEMDDLLSQLRQQQSLIEQQKQRIVSSQNQTAKSKTPVWDNIDSFVDNMTDIEVEAMNNNAEYQQLQQRLMSIINREYMIIMRPIVESTKDGKEVLEQLYSVTKNIKKTNTEETNKNIALFNEYTAKYSDMPYSEFLKLKNSGKKKA